MSPSAARSENADMPPRSLASLPHALKTSLTPSIAPPIARVRPNLPKSRSHLERTQQRMASTEGREKKDWIVILPDVEGVLEKRMGVRP